MKIKKVYFSLVIGWYAALFYVILPGKRYCFPEHYTAIKGLYLTNYYLETVTTYLKAAEVQIPFNMLCNILMINFFALIGQKYFWFYSAFRHRTCNRNLYLPALFDDLVGSFWRGLVVVSF
jgi:hypothetical protein